MIETTQELNNAMSGRCSEVLYVFYIEKYCTVILERKEKIFLIGARALFITFVIIRSIYVPSEVLTHPLPFPQTHQN